MKSIIRQFARQAYGTLLSSRTRGRIKKLVKNNKNIKLEIGAGQKGGKNGWVTLDLHKESDLPWDLRNGIPFPDNSVSVIYSSHLFEHLTFPQILILLNECRRVLAPNGIFSICSPNARLYLEAYVNKDDTFWELHPPGYEPALNATTRIDMVNYMAYMAGHHKYMFDEENVLFLLTKCGLRNARLRDFDPEIDLVDRQHESLYGMAEK